MRSTKGAEPERKQSFWTTLPGVLTGIAALLTAVTGFLVVLYQHGFSGSKESSVVVVPSTETARPASTVAGGPAAGTSPAVRQKPVVLVTGKDGSESRVFLNSFRDSYSGEVIRFKNGQSIAFEKMSSVDFVETNDYEQNVRVTLTDGRALEGAIMSGERLTGDTDIGPFSISANSVKRIVFER